VGEGFGDAEGAREDEGAFALAGGEVAVAGAEGKAVLFTNDGADDERDGEVEVADDLAEDGDLGGVLLAEVGAVGRDDVEEAGDDGGDAAEVAGARGSVEAGGDGAGVDEGRIAGRIHGCGGGSEEEVDAGGFQFGAVFVEGARVGGEVFGGTELGGVDEDGDGDGVVLGEGCRDEREMAGVERAHGGNETEGVFGVAQGATGGVHFVGRAAEDHG